MKRLTFFIFFCLLFLVGCQQKAAPTSSQALILKSVYSAAIANNYIILGSLENGAFVYSKTLEAPVYQWHMGAEDPAISAIAIAKNVPIAITTSGSRLVIWDLATGKALHYLSAPATINAVDINDDGSFAVLGLSNNQATIINLTKGGVAQSFAHNSSVIAVALWNNQYLLTGEEANKATLWSFDSGKALATQTHNDGVTQVGFSADGQMALSSSRYDVVKIWRTQDNGKTIESLSTKSKGLLPGKRLVDFIFLSEQELLLGYSTKQVEQQRIGEPKAKAHWNVVKKKYFGIEGTALIAVGVFNNQPVAITSNGLLQTLQKP